VPAGPTALVLSPLLSAQGERDLSTIPAACKRGNRYPALLPRGALVNSRPTMQQGPAHTQPRRQGPEKPSLEPPVWRVTRWARRGVKHAHRISTSIGALQCVPGCGTDDRPAEADEAERMDANPCYSLYAVRGSEEMSSACVPLDARGCHALADALGDTPETVISVHLLRRGLCRAYMAGQPVRFKGAIVQADDLPTEPTGFGSDPRVLWDLLRSAKGWDCVNVVPGCAPALGELIEGETGVRVRYYGDIYHVLSRPAPGFESEVVRRLGLADIKLLESAPAELRGSGFGSPRGLLSDGVVACAVVSDQIASIAHTSARTECHAEIGVYTLENWRGRGFATAAAAIVARCVQEMGQIPVWSAGEGNRASLRVAEKLGFREVSRRVYVILDKGD